MMISLVLPLYNEESLVKELIGRVGNAISNIPHPAEIIIVDDGSEDDTLAVLLEERKKDDRIKIISFSRNFGLQAAIFAGMEYAGGESIIVLDGDLQDPPELIPGLIKRLEDNDLDIVVGRRLSRAERWPKRVLIRWFHNIIEPKYSKARNFDTGNFCIMKKEVVKSIVNARERLRYFPGLRSYTGFKVDYLDYERQPRSNGTPKMTYRKLIFMAGDALFSFSKWPIRICLITGIISMIIFLLALVYALVSKILGLAPLSWSSTFIIVYLFGTFQLLFMGIMGEYIYRVYKEVQDRPLYIVRKIYN